MSNSAEGGLEKQVVILHRAPLSFLQKTDMFMRKFENMIHFT